MREDKKLIYFLVALIIFLSVILLIKIKKEPKYDPKVYEDIYNEYEDIFGKENNKNKTDENNTNTTFAGTTQSNMKQGNVIGKIIIPKIEISYPIIKETTTEYLKVAPTKYCGPEVNEIRKFSYSRA